MPAAFSTFQADTCYQAMKARDARFDGSFYTGVTSTGIYCRPVCRVRLPRRENCVFFGHAAQAEHAGFRPCLRCRPELAPRSPGWSIQDASAILAQQAARLLDAPQAWSAEPASARRLAERLGVSDRHVRRLFEANFGVSPVQYLQTRRLLTAKQLLADTDLPVAQVALISGFASVRRFNAAFASHYQLNPTELRRRRALPGLQGACTVRLGYRPPYDVAAMLGFFRQRQIAGLEFADVGDASLARTVAIEQRGRQWCGWLVARFDPGRHRVELQMAASLRDVLPQVIHQVRALLDLDADPAVINARLQGSFPGGDGLRVPGALCGFELAVRAVLGQQITVVAARTLAQRLTERFGEPIETPFATLTRLFPRAEVLARADGEALGQLGIVRQRQQAIQALAQAVADARLPLHGGVDAAATITALKALPGIGDWTAQYIAMRALRWPDALPASDVALQKALGVQGAQAARAAEAASQRWRPWRSYAVVRAWAGLGPSTEAARPQPTELQPTSMAGASHPG